MQRKVLYFNNFTISQCYHHTKGNRSHSRIYSWLFPTSSLSKLRRKLCRKLSFERRRWGVGWLRLLVVLVVLLWIPSHKLQSESLEKQPPTQPRTQHQNVTISTHCPPAITSIGEVLATFWLLKIVKFMHALFDLLVAADVIYSLDTRH